MRKSEKTMLVGIIGLVLIGTGTVFAVTDDVMYVLFSDQIVLVLEFSDDEYHFLDAFIYHDDKWHLTNSTSIQTLDSQNNKGWLIGTTDSGTPFYSTFIIDEGNRGEIGVWIWDDGKVIKKRTTFELIRLF